MKANLSILLIFSVAIYTNVCIAYKVAVVEYNKQHHDGFANNIKYNLNNYLKIIEETIKTNQNVDVIVFPEGTLVFQYEFYTKQDLLQHASLLPNKSTMHATTSWAPCLQTNETSHYVQELSCASRTHNVYISANIIEKSSGGLLFNTNIVFDRQGRLVSKYRKMKPLSIERYITAGNNVEYFHTDFGVTLGVFVCFDIFFKNSYETILNNVDGFIFPSYWYSELPFLSSVQVQNMWSFYNNKVLIASGGNNQTTGTSGTGIYSGKSNAYKTYISSDTTNKVLISEIQTENAQQKTFPINQNVVRPKKHEIDHFRDLQNFNFIEKRPKMNIHPVETFATQFDLTNIEQTICDGSFCCKFQLNVNNTSGLSFIIYNGMQEFIGFGSLGIQLCGIMQCEKDNCYTMPKQECFHKIFNHLEVQIVNSTSNVDYYPNISLKDLYFLQTEDFTFTPKDLRLKLLKNTTGIYMFGFYGRNYKMDDLP